MPQPVKLWEKIEIVIGEGEKAGHFTARVEDFLAEGIIIGSPEFLRGNTLLRENSDVMLLITKEDAVYQCVSRIRRLQGNDKKLYILSPPRNIRRVQRRQFVRIDWLLPIKYTKVVPVMDWEEYEERAVWQESKIINISGGGALMDIDENIELEDRLLLNIPNFADMGLPQIVAALCRRIINRRGCALAGVEFVVADVLKKHFSREDLERLPRCIQHFGRMAQNRLVTEIFHKQIEFRKKGLL